MAKADTAGRPDDPDLAPDATPAEDLGNEEDRRKEQLAYYGGEEDDIDDFDPTGLDDGSSLEPPAESTDEDKDEDDAEHEETDETDETASDDAGDQEEDSEESEEEGEAEEGDAEVDGDDETSRQAEKPQGIPKHRFDEVNERRKAAEAELEQLRKQQKAEEEGEKEEYDFDAAESEYMELLLDGKTDEALAKRKEIRAAEKATWSNETKHETQRELAQRQQIEEIQTLTQDAEKLFPVFDENHEDFDPEITSKALAYYQGYVATGNYATMSDAFVDALADVVQLYGLDQRYGTFADEEGEADPEPKPTGKKRDDEKTRKKEEARKKAHQPAAAGGTASDDAGAVAPDINNMTDEELEALPAATLARLRGDIL